MSPADRIRKLVADGRIGEAEGARLLATLESARPLAKLDPFERLGGGIAATIGVVGAGASVAITRLGASFDGALDLHVGRVPPLGAAVLQQVASFVVPAVLFWAYARTRNAHVRLLDFVGMVGLARLPVILGALPMIWLAPPEPASVNDIHFSPALLAVAFLAFVMLGLQIALLFFGFRNASNLSGKALGIGFAVMLLVAEIASKLVLFIH